MEVDAEEGASVSASAGTACADVGIGRGAAVSTAEAEFAAAKVNGTGASVKGAVIAGTGCDNVHEGNGAAGAGVGLPKATGVVANVNGGGAVKMKGALSREEEAEVCALASASL